ncbi:MAG: hydantoinase/oxoprolinase family protein [Bacteroidota bacterium]|nr:hydantoinase/oxoprolinase family protein [Bacteroidota bacterium]MDW8138578.1 hydantoinase/oxoprolinase family protein [Bacteroidota bacterium]
MSYRIGIDIGGTFTDFVVYEPETGRLWTFKRFSTPSNPAQAVLEGLRAIGPGAHAIVHGSTVATNALLERKGARTAFVTTEGFRDLLHIGRQNREALYDLAARRTEPLVPRAWCFEVPERVGADGSILRALEDSALPGLVEALRRIRAESVAVCLLFSFLRPEHERRIGEALRAAGLRVTLSVEVLPEFREYERASTTVASAYVAPILDRYLSGLERALGAHSFRVMQSNGGLMRSEEARAQAVRCALSGPAGGVIGAQYVAALCGQTQLITLDMGGTSTDVSLLPGELPLTTEGAIGGLPIRVPILDIHTIGAGGGSIASVDPGGALRVGPQSAGADPGPACYGRGGTWATVTDAHVVLGRLVPERFLGGAFRLQQEAAAEALARLARALRLETPAGLSSAQAAAWGVLQVAHAHMERALRVISVERGYDPRDFVLVSFGGAGPLHAVELAQSLGIRRVLVPAYASVLSALGMLAADVRRDYVQTVMLPEQTAYGELARRFGPLLRRARQELRREGFFGSRMLLERYLEVRYVGQSYELRIPFSRSWRKAFDGAHRRAYGHADPTAPVEITNLRLHAVGLTTPPKLPELESAGPEPEPGALLEERPVVVERSLRVIPVYNGSALRPGNRLKGPALCVRPDTTVYLPPRSAAYVDRFGNLLVELP